MDKLKIECLKRFQRLLWSITPEKVDFNKDRSYIIHQVPARGEPEDLKFLFKIYGFDKVKNQQKWYK